MHFCAVKKWFKVEGCVSKEAMDLIILSLGAGGGGHGTHLYSRSRHHTGETRVLGLIASGRFGKHET